MTKDTHFAALKAAAKLALGVAFLGGCTAAATEEETVNAESEINKAPCPEKKDAGQPEKKSCDQVLASAFPEGPNGGEWNPDSDGGTAVSAEVKTCCEETLTKEREESWNIPYRWQCCDVTGGFGFNSGNPAVAVACTPWGPPVPPKMRRRIVALEGVV